MADSYSIVRLTPLRKIIAARMAEAKQTIPHYRIVVDIDVGELFGARAKFNALHPESKVTVNDCVIKACASALMACPTVNAQFVGDEVRQYHDADISVVIAVEGGLATPVVRGANKKTVREIAAEVKSLSARAAAKQLKMDDILGGSFSISNLGSYGIDQFDAIISPPQCAILAVGRAKPRIVVSESGEPHVATVLRASLSLDHRVIDGVVGAAFLTTVREALERPKELFAPYAG